jgi:hypothetical protein
MISKLLPGFTRGFTKMTRQNGKASLEKEAGTNACSTLKKLIYIIKVDIYYCIHYSFLNNLK